MFPNISRGIFNLPYLQGGAGANAGPKYSTVNPFRTVDKIGQYGGGLNASASQLYDHFRRDGKAADHGLPYGGDVQTLESFTQRFNPQPIQPPEMNIPPPKVPTSGGYQGIIPNFNFNPAGGIFNMPNMGQFPIQQQMQQQNPSVQQRMGQPVMPSGNTERPHQQLMQMPNMSSIFNQMPVRKM